MFKKGSGFLILPPPLIHLLVHVHIDRAWGPGAKIIICIVQPTKAILTKAHTSLQLCQYDDSIEMESYENSSSLKAKPKDIQRTPELIFRLDRESTF